MGNLTINFSATQIVGNRPIQTITEDVFTPTIRNRAKAPASQEFTFFNNARTPSELLLTISTLEYMRLLLLFSELSITFSLTRSIDRIC